MADDERVDLENEAGEARDDKAGADRASHEASQREADIEGEKADISEEEAGE